MAEVEFPNLVPANLADVHSNALTVSPATDLINTAIRYVYVFVKALLALLLSSGGLILLLSLHFLHRLLRSFVHSFRSLMNLPRFAPPSFLHFIPPLPLSPSPQTMGVNRESCRFVALLLN